MRRSRPNALELHPYSNASSCTTLVPSSSTDSLCTPDKAYPRSPISPSPLQQHGWSRERTPSPWDPVTPNLHPPPSPHPHSRAASSDTLDYFSDGQTDLYGSRTPSIYAGSTTNLLPATDSRFQFPAPRTKPRKWTDQAKRPFVAIYRTVASQVSLRAILDFIDVREYFWPFTWRKYLVLLSVCSLVAMIIVTNHYFHWIEKAMEQTRQNMLPVLILVVGLEPLMVILLLCVAKVPDLPRPTPASMNDTTVTFCEESEPKSQASSDSEETKKHYWDEIDIETLGDPESVPPKHSTGLVIPCHNSDRDALQRVLETAYPHFRPEDIFIVDNGRSPTPSDPTFREWLEENHPGCVYIWSPIGSKNAAQLVGSMAAKHCNYILTIDDDVLIPANFSPPEEMIDDEFKAVAFPIRAHDADGHTGLFMVGWQDCEYRLSGLSKMAEYRISGVLFPHGAGSFVERKTFIELLSEHHPMDFYGDDTQCGLCLMKMGKKIAFDARVVLGTEVPTTVIGPGLNWWKQRFKSWEMARHGLTVDFSKRLLFSLNGQKTVQGILWQKFLFLYAILSNIVDWIRVPVFVTMGGDGGFWLKAMLMTLFAAFPLMAYNYVKCRRRKDLRTPFWAAATFPVYKQLYALVSIFGAIRCVLYYIGGHPRPKTIKQMLKEGDSRCFWLDSRFEENPGYLAYQDAGKT